MEEESNRKKYSLPVSQNKEKYIKVGSKFQCAEIDVLVWDILTTSIDTAKTNIPRRNRNSLVLSLVLVVMKYSRVQLSWLSTEKPT